MGGSSTVWSGFRLAVLREPRWPSGPRLGSPKREARAGGESGHGFLKILASTGLAGPDPLAPPPTKQPSA